MTISLDRFDRVLAEHGLRRSERDPLHDEIPREAIRRWGEARVLAGLRKHLGGDMPTYALEPIGAALGEEYECPYQMEKCDE